MRLVTAIFLLSLTAACRPTPGPSEPLSPSAAAQGLPPCPAEYLAGMENPDTSLDWRHYVRNGISLCVPATWRGGGRYWSWDNGFFVFSEGNHYMLSMRPRSHDDPRRGLLQTEASGMPAEFWYMDNATRYERDRRGRRPGDPIAVRRRGFSTFGSWPTMDVYMAGTAENTRGIAEIRMVFLTVRFVPIASTGLP